MKTARAGFTLIELLAVMLIIGILMAFLVPQIPKAMDRTYVSACRANLDNIGKGLIEYHATFKKWPSESGARFHCCLIGDKIWEATPSNAKRLTCPNVSSDSLAIRGLPEEEWYVDLEMIDGSYSAYAGRNTADHAIRLKTPSGKKVLVADDNDPDGNHRTTTLALMGDWTVREYELVDLQKRQLVDEEAEWLVVGSESPLEELQELSLD